MKSSEDKRIQVMGFDFESVNEACAWFMKHSIFQKDISKSISIDSWQCPACRTWFGPKSEQVCRCEKEEK